MKPMSVRIPEDLQEKLDERAKILRRTKASLIVEAIENLFLANGNSHPLQPTAPKPRKKATK